MKERDWEERLKPTGTLAVLAGVCLALGGVAFSAGAGDLGVLLLAVAVFFATLHVTRRLDVAGEPLKRALFRERRPTRLDQARTALRDRDHRGVVVISGASGTGKSVLASLLVEDLGGQSVERRDYGPTAAKTLLDEVGQLRSAEPAVIVLDQLEKLFSLSAGEAREQRAAIGEVIKRVRAQSEWRCLLIIRREFFLDLTAFADLRPILGGVLVVGGFDSVAEHDAFDRFENRISELLEGNPTLAKRILEDSAISVQSQPGQPERLEVLPVCAVAVTESLSFTRRSAELSVPEYVRRGGLRGAVERLFEALLDGCGDRLQGARVLAALSVEPRSRRPLRAADIARITGLPIADVRARVRYFIDSEFLQPVDPGRVEWVHDFFAESFNEIGGRYLDPAERDNIAYFAERLNTRGPGAVPAASVQDKRAESFTWGLFITAVLLLAARLISLPLLEGDPATAGIFSSIPIHRFQSLPGNLVDWSFLPTAVCLVAWSWYTTALHRRLFAHLDEPKGRVVLSYWMSCGSIVLVLLSVLFPRLWIALVGLGGLAVGVKYLVTSRDFGKDWRRAELFFGRAGLTTCFNCLITLLVGVGFAVFLVGQAPSRTDWSVAFAVTVSGSVLLYFAWVTSIHIRRSRMPLVVGIYRRYGRKPREAGNGA